MADSRAGFVRKAALAGAGLAGAFAGLGPLARPAGATTTNDIEILNFALTLEYLEADFYADAIAKGGLRRPRVAALAATIHRQEAAHVSFLLGALGTAAVPKPVFDFKGTTAGDVPFLATATFLEETGVRGYSGQAPLIDDRAVLKAVLALQTVEARHAAWVRAVRDIGPAPDAFDSTLTMKQTLAALRRRGLLP
jgi:rubrerythrin